jgi:hypothetical protein
MEKKSWEIELESYANDVCYRETVIVTSAFCMQLDQSSILVGVDATQITFNIGAIQSIKEVA